MAGPFSPIQTQIDAFFPPSSHPYRRLERAILEHVESKSSVLDIGCGRTAPNLRTLVGRAGALTGIDLVEFECEDDRLRLIKTDVSHMPEIADESIDVAYSRSVMEHVEAPDRAFREIHRVLRPGGVYIFLTPSLYDYGSIVASLVPNSLHPAIVRRVEGRAEADVFPTRFRANTRRAIERLTRDAGLKIKTFEYTGQYPSYLRFSRPLFYLGSMYQKLLEKTPPLHPLQGWIFATVEKDRRGPPATR